MDNKMKIIRKKKLSKLQMGFHRYLLASVLIIFLSGCAGSDKNIRGNHNFGGLSEQEKERLSEASFEPSFEKAESKKDPSNLKSHELEEMGDLALHSGEIHMAFVHYEEALKKKPGNTGLIYKKGLTFLLGNLNKEAITSFQEVVEKEPENSLAYKGLGQAFFKIKNYEEAELNFQKALDLDPSLWEAHNFLGIIYDRQKKYNKASLEYNAAVSQKPDEGLLYNNLGASYCLAGEFEKAIITFRKALEVNYLESKTYNNLGFALAKAGRYREAHEAFLKGGGDEAQVYNNLGCVRLNQGEFEKAIADFEKAIEISPAYYDKAGDNLKRARIASINYINSLYERGSNDN
jgi:Flp pilus assembly protein TadD